MASHTSPVSSGNISRSAYEELKHILISGLSENQRQIALLRRDFAKSQGNETPPDVQEILAEYNDEEDTDELPLQTERKTHLVIKTTKEDD